MTAGWRTKNVRFFFRDVIVLCAFGPRRLWGGGEKVLPKAWRHRRYNIKSSRYLFTTNYARSLRLSRCFGRRCGLTRNRIKSKLTYEIFPKDIRQTDKNIHKTPLLERNVFKNNFNMRTRMVAKTRVVKNRAHKITFRAEIPTARLYNCSIKTPLSVRLKGLIANV